MNKNLVKGALALGTPTQPTWNDSLAAGYMEGNKISKIAQQYARVKKDAINQKVAGYIDSLDTNVDVTELTEDQQKAVTTYLVDQRNEYAVAASQIAKIEDPSSPMYSELRDKINGIQMSFKNLAGQVNSYKKDKASYLKDFDNNLIYKTTATDSPNMQIFTTNLGSSNGNNVFGINLDAIVIGGTYGISGFKHALGHVTVYTDAVAGTAVIFGRIETSSGGLNIFADLAS